MKRPRLSAAERQRIRRKALRWAAKFAALKPDDRAAVREAILALVEPKQYDLALSAIESEATNEELCECQHNGFDHGPTFCTGLMMNGSWCLCKRFSPSTALPSHADREVKAGGGSEATQARRATYAEVCTDVASATKRGPRKAQGSSKGKGDSTGHEGLVPLCLFDLDEGNAESRRTVLAFVDTRKKSA